MPARSALPLLAVTVLAAAALTGCDPAPDPVSGQRQLPPPVAPSRTVTSRPPLPTISRPPTGATTRVFPEQTTAPCAGHPTPDQIVALLRRSGTRFLPANAAVTFQTGPLCAGTWQYSVLLVPDHDPLQVVTEGASASLRLVTAGTDVCTVDVRVNAPAGIRNITRC
jgi:hypothetical protein